MFIVGKKTIREAILEVYNRLNSDGVIDQTTLAKMIGKSDGAVSDYLNGRRRMHEDTILRLCRALGVRWQDLDVSIDLPQDPTAIARLTYSTVIAGKRK